MILSTVLQEKQRIERMILRYNEILRELPRGSISERNIKGNTYHYLKYRDGKKVISKYIRKDNLENVRAELEKRKHVETMLEALREEYELAEKVLGGNL